MRNTPQSALSSFNIIDSSYNRTLVTLSAFGDVTFDWGAIMRAAEDEADQFYFWSRALLAARKEGPVANDVGPVE